MTTIITNLIRILSKHLIYREELYALSIITLASFMFYYIIDRLIVIYRKNKCGHSEDNQKGIMGSLSFLIADAFHNMVDGFLIGNVFLMSNIN